MYYGFVKYELQIMQFVVFCCILLYFGTFFERWTHFRKDGHNFGKMDTKRKDWTQNGKIGHKTERLDIF